MNKRIIMTAVLAATTGWALYGCGSGGGTPAASVAVNGTVADGYLRGAEVFLDKNGTYQWDGVEPRTMSGPGGTYSLTVQAGDMGKYPVVVRAIAGSTVDEDTGQTVQNSFIMSAPAGMGNFVSPMTSLIREKMEANPGMTAAQAMTQLRNQLNLPAGMDMMADYVTAAQAGQYQTQYQSMHATARQMAALMMNEAGLVMNGSVVYKNRYRGMMGEINQYLPQIANNAYQGMGMNSTFMSTLMSQMQTLLAAMPMMGGFGNYSTMFTNMTSHQIFWNYTGSHWQPTGTMMGMP